MEQLETVFFDANKSSELMPNCVYATTYAKKYNCIVVMYWQGIYYECTPGMTAAKYYKLINTI